MSESSSPMTSGRTPGRHFLQIPGPTNVPDPVLRAIDRPTIDHRGPEFQRLARRVLEGLQPIFGTAGPIVIYPASGTGAWEAALVNTLSPGDAVLMVEQGHFAGLWRDLALRLELEVELIPSDWRVGVDAGVIESRLAEDRAQRLKAVCVVHNETSTGVTSDIQAVRRAIDAAGHPALLMVDTISSLGSMPYAHDAWGVDVTVAGSQKGLMLPPGLSFNAISEKARMANASARCPRSYWDWAPMLDANARGFFPYTPSTNLLFGLDAALELLMAEGLDTVFARHARHAAATRAAVEAWGLELFARDPGERSASLTAVLLPEGSDADAVRAAALDRFDLSLGAGLSRLAGKVFRIGHLGDFNDLTLLGTLAGCEMALEITGPRPEASGVVAAMYLLSQPLPTDPG